MVIASGLETAVRGEELSRATLREACAVPASSSARMRGSFGDTIRISLLPPFLAWEMRMVSLNSDETLSSYASAAMVTFTLAVTSGWSFTSTS